MSGRTIIAFDYAIKYALRDKANFDILSGFLTELLERKVTILDLLKSDSNKDEDEAKINHIDLKAKIDDGEIAIFGIRCYRMADRFFENVRYGVSKAVTKQVSSGGEHNIKNVYSISIADYELGAKSDYIFQAKKDGFKGLHTEELIQFAQPSPPTGVAADIHLEYYLVLPRMFDKNIQNKLDEWIYTLKTSTVKSKFTASGIQEAGIKLEMLEMSLREFKAYERYQMVKANEESIFRTAINNGIARGKAKYEATLTAERIQMIKKMDAKGIDATTIAEITKLTVEEIVEAIKNE